MKQWIVWLMAGALLIGLFGCGTKTGTETGTGSETTLPQSTAEPTTPTDTESQAPQDTKPSTPNTPDTPQNDLKQYEHTVVLNSGTEGIKILGERCLESTTQLNADWTGSGLEFVIDCKGGDLTLRTCTTDPCYFRVWVDGEEWKNTDNTLYWMINGTKNMVIPNLSVGVHTVRVVKVTGYTLARAHFYSMTFYGSLLKDQVPADNNLYIEFVGDSICCGWGTIGNHQGAYTDQDGAQAYPYLVAQAMQADYAVTALSGQGLLMGNPGMTNGYGYASPMRDSTNLDPFERTANLVVINIGTNDYGYRDKYGIDEEAFEQAYLNFVKNVYSKNGESCKIYCLYNTMNDTYANAILRVCERLGGEAAGIYTYRMNRTASGHPTLAEQSNYAQALTAFLNETKDNAVTERLGGAKTTLVCEENGIGMEIDYAAPAWSRNIH